MFPPRNRAAYCERDPSFLSWSTASPVKESPVSNEGEKEGQAMARYRACYSYSETLFRETSASLARDIAPLSRCGTREFNHEIVRFGFQGPRRRHWPLVEAPSSRGLRSLAKIALRVNFFFRVPVQARGAELFGPALLSCFRLSRRGALSTPSQNRVKNFFRDPFFLFSRTVARSEVPVFPGGNPMSLRGGRI